MSLRGDKPRSAGAAGDINHVGLRLSAGLSLSRLCACWRPARARHIIDAVARRVEG
jgi:hypothetical protein